VINNKPIALPLKKTARMEPIGKIGDQSGLNNQRAERLPEAKQTEIASLKISFGDTLNAVCERQYEIFK
jgi:hypothetical protein